jgi:hypothetical protein
VICNAILKRKVALVTSHVDKTESQQGLRNLVRRQLTPSQFRLLGVLPLTFFLAQAIHYWQIKQLGHMLWMCNIGNLLLALGLFFQRPLLTRVAVVWALPGLIVWCVYVVPTWGMLLTGNFSFTELFGVISSSLAHLGGISVGIIALRRIRMDRSAWMFVFVWYLIVQLLSRLVTSPELNVNLSHRVQDGFEQTFSSYWQFWLILTLLIGLGSVVISLTLHRLWPPKEWG